MLTDNERHIRLQGAFNVRDLGGYATAGGGTTRWRSFLRADALHGLTGDDVRALLDLGLRTVIDLRSSVELAHQPSVFLRHDRVRYHHIAIFDGLAPTEMMLRDDRGSDLSHRYVQAADSCRPALMRVAATIADAEEGLVLFNCTAGKDRTGIVAAMLLSLAGVPTEDIAADYALTGELAGPLMEQLKATVIARGMDEAVAARLLSSQRTSMLTFLRHMEDRHAGFANYLAVEPAGRDFIRMIEARLLDRSSRTAAVAAERA